MDKVQWPSFSELPPLHVLKSSNVSCGAGDVAGGGREASGVVGHARDAGDRPMQAHITSSLMYMLSLADLPQARPDQSW